MKRAIHENSLKAYNSIIENLNNKQDKVFEQVFIFGPITNEGICDKLNANCGKVIYYPHQISGRLTELKELGIVKESEKRGKTRAGRTCAQFIAVR